MSSVRVMDVPYNITIHSYVDQSLIKVKSIVYWEFEKLALLTTFNGEKVMYIVSHSLEIIFMIQYTRLVL